MPAILVSWTPLSLWDQLFRQKYHTFPSVFIHVIPLTKYAFCPINPCSQKFLLSCCLLLGRDRKWSFSYLCIWTTGCASSAHCTGSLTDMHQCVLAQVRRMGKWESLWAIYIVAISEMGRVPLVSNSKGSIVNTSDGRPLFPCTQDQARGRMCVNAHTSQYIGQHNSCTPDITMATCIHPYNPFKQTERMATIVPASVCVHIPLSFNVWFHPAVKTVICAHLGPTEILSSNTANLRHIPSWPPSSLFQTLQTFFHPTSFHPSHHLIWNWSRHLASRKSQKCLCREERKIAKRTVWRLSAEELVRVEGTVSFWTADPAYLFVAKASWNFGRGWYLECCGAKKSVNACSCGSVSTMLPQGNAF